MPAYQKTVATLYRQIGFFCLATLLSALPLLTAHAQKQIHGDVHAHHTVEQRIGYERSVHNYNIPDVMLVNNRGEKVSLLSELESDQILMMNFIFTSCTAICPVLSATFSQVRKQLGPSEKKLRMVSISIDPEHDTPQQLMTYANHFGAGKEWQFLTGDPADIIQIQHAFTAYRGNKMNHIPLTFLRAAVDSPWVRLEGFTGVENLVHEYHLLVEE